ncbi:disulfide bond formation protein B [Magnetovibrio sp.]|uniref:disulfide bond formation protein B n=1 Tax=Magnetovibrio sp. TaxID=2024836 RepID=UPI002F930F21
MKNIHLYPTFLILVGVGSLAAAYTAQYGFDLEPCVLCLYQRVPFAVAIVLGFVGLLRPRWLGVVFVLAAAVFAINGAIAFYHVGVEQHWWSSAVGCGGKLPTQVSTADLLASLERKAPKSCDAVDWTMLGISMAGWNILFSNGLALASLYVLRTRKWET